jgi:hypothetical protein
MIVILNKENLLKELQKPYRVFVEVKNVWMESRFTGLGAKYPLGFQVPKGATIELIKTHVLDDALFRVCIENNIYVRVPKDTLTFLGHI